MAFVALLLVGCCALFAGFLYLMIPEEEVQCKLRSSTGAEVVVSMISNVDDPGYGVFAAVWDDDHKQVQSRINIGLTFEGFGCEEVGLREEPSGRYLGLYSKEYPDILILLIDLEVPRLVIDSYRSQKWEAVEILRKLSDASEVPLQFGGRFVFPSRHFYDLGFNFIPARNSSQAPDACSVLPWDCSSKRPKEAVVKP